MENKVVVITGGAGQVGSATAKRLASKGCRIVLIVRSKPELAQKLCDELPNSNLEHFYIQASVTNNEEMRIAAAQVRNKAGRCDLLVNAAGVSYGKSNDSPLSTTEDTLQKTFDVNVKGILNTVNNFYPMLRERTGVVINLSSMAGFKSRSNSLAYSACKSAVNIMTECYAKSLGPVRFLAIAPSTLENPTSGRQRMPPNIVNTYKESIPLKRIPNGNDVAEVIDSIFNDMKFLNGNIIKLDGGFNL